MLELLCMWTCRVQLDFSVWSFLANCLPWSHPCPEFIILQKLRSYVPFLLHCIAQQLQRCLRLIFQHHPPAHCPQARDKSCYWTHHLDVLTLCDMIYRESSFNYNFSYFLHWQNAENTELPRWHGPQPLTRTAFCLQPQAPKKKVKRYSANNHDSIYQCQKWKTGSCFPNSERRPHHRSSPPSNRRREPSAPFFSLGAEAATVMGQAISDTAASRQELRD